MGRSIALRPINDIIAEMRKNHEESVRNTVEYMNNEFRETIARIESNRLAFAMLDAAGIDLELPEWKRGASHDIELGYFPSTKAGNRELAGKLNTIRRALESPLQKESQHLEDAKKRLIKIKLAVKDFPGLAVYYIRKLPAKGKAKCRLVRERTTTVRLVCDVAS